LWAQRTTTLELYRTPLTWTAGYDNRDHLTSFTRAGASTHYTYDANSNRLTSIDKTTSDTDIDGQFTEQDAASTTSQVSLMDGDSNRLLGFTQTLTTMSNGKVKSVVTAPVNYIVNANGSMTSDGLREFDYDAANRLAKVTVSKDGEAARVVYLTNAMGQRVFKSVTQAEQTLPDETTLDAGFIAWLKKSFGWLFTNSITTTGAGLGTAYVYGDGPIPAWAMLGEYDNGSAVGKGRTEYIWLPTQDGQALPVGMYRNGKFYAVHADHLGTPRLITDEANKPVWQWPYSAFGNNAPTGVLQATPNPKQAITNQPVLLKASKPIEMNLRFPGQYFDAETGLFYNWQRYYSDKGGRYIQSDRIGLDGGMNRFGYGGGNPLAYTDPLGQNPLAAAAGFCFTNPLGFLVCAGGVAAMSTPQGQQAAMDIVNKIVDMCTPGDPGGPNGHDPCKGIRKQLEKHERKLSEYLNHPLLQDNRGLLTNALLGNDGTQASRVYESRINELRKQIEGWKRELKKCEEKNGK
uniref:RHS repeat-associated core domain-containing protein n=1 Tax=Caenimonas koreensis TaxID=367474 RepID=UPI0037838DBC